jgi:hypothetical protein
MKTHEREGEGATVDTISVKYCFGLPDGGQEVFDLRFDAESFGLLASVPETPPSWTALDFHQCPNCTLSAADHPYCPLVVNIVDIVKRFGDLVSHDEIRLEVVTEERCVSQVTTAQRGICSLMGLLIATGGCPHTAVFRPMARFHLPLASEEETAYRVTSMYLLAQYYLMKAGKEASFELDGLRQVYDRVHMVNASVAKRLRAATTADASVNALIMLDVFAMGIPFTIEDSLEDIRRLFLAYLP